jgi:uncharacterized damage-inducible protein DinB
MHRRLATLLALTLVPLAARAQGVAATKPLYDDVKDNIIKSAEMLSAVNYAYKPTPKVRSFGQLIGHIANANYMLCATAKGEKNPATQDFEKNTKKADLVKAVKDAFAYCDGLYNMADADLSASAEMFGMKMSRLSWTIMNVTHNNLHYGNLITYLRLKGMTPPSSMKNGV